MQIKRNIYFTAVSTMSMPYCIQCEQTVDQLMLKMKTAFCQKCGTALQYKCMKCNKQYRHYRSMSYHLKNTCNKDTVYRCSKCDFSSTSEHSVALHAQRRHNPWKLPYHKCKKCGKSLKYTWSLTRHKKYCKMYQNGLNKRKPKENNVNKENIKSHKGMVSELYNLVFTIFAI